MAEGLIKQFWFYARATADAVRLPRAICVCLRAVGPLIEVPVLILLVNFALKQQKSFIDR